MAEKSGSSPEVGPNDFAWLPGRLPIVAAGFSTATGRERMPSGADVTRPLHAHASLSAGERMSHRTDARWMPETLPRDWPPFAFYATDGEVASIGKGARCYLRPTC
jgi:hypothetical protein